jgi:hypothetical protein
LNGYLNYWICFRFCFLKLWSHFVFPHTVTILKPWLSFLSCSFGLHFKGVFTPVPSAFPFVASCWKAGSLITLQEFLRKLTT